MESPANRAAYWPGGIPAYIRCHPEPIEDGMMEEVKGWQLFIEVRAGQLTERQICAEL